VTYTLSSYLVGGDHLFRVTGSSGTIGAQKTLYINAASVILKALNENGLSEGKEGTEVVISGANYIPGEEAEIYFNFVKISPDGFKIENDGSVRLEYIIPSGLSTGEYEFKIVTETYEAATKFYIDNEPPVKPLVNVAVGKRSIEISWSASTGTDVQGYRIYKKIDGTFQKISEVNKTVFALTQNIITDVMPGVEYVYAVSAFDRLGNESDKTEATASLLPDEIQPAVSTFSPSDGSYVSKDKDISMYAYDDQHIDRFLLEYSTDNKATFKPLLFNGKPSYQYSYGDKHYYSYIFKWQTLTNNYTDGNYILRLTVFDLSGKSSSLERNYIVDNTPPPAPENLTAVSGTNTVTLFWDPVLTDAVTIIRCIKALRLKSLHIILQYMAQLRLKLR
jgi:hypothetical protein